MTPDQNTLDITSYSDSCRWESIAREPEIKRQLFSNALKCPLLAQNKIEHMGIMHAHYPYKVRRVNQSGSFFMACTKGTGAIHIDGKWEQIKAGQACILPPYMTNAFQTVDGSELEFAWVRYIEPKDKRTIADTDFPRLGDYNSLALKNTIEGLYNELNGESWDPVVSSWINLIHQQVLRFTSPQKIDARILHVLKTMAANLAHDWTLSEIADIANMSEEHLRRLTNVQLGRSPMQQLTFMRMSRAKQLIINTDAKIDHISKEVGYSNQFSFSNAFLKWVGCRPSQLR